MLGLLTFSIICRALIPFKLISIVIVHPRFASSYPEHWWCIYCTTRLCNIHFCFSLKVTFNVTWWIQHAEVKDRTGIISFCRLDPAWYRVSCHMDLEATSPQRSFVEHVVRACWLLVIGLEWRCAQDKRQANILLGCTLEGVGLGWVKFWRYGTACEGELE